MTGYGHLERCCVYDGESIYNLGEQAWPKFVFSWVDVGAVLERCCANTVIQTILCPCCDTNLAQYWFGNVGYPGFFFVKIQPGIHTVSVFFIWPD